MPPPSTNPDAQPDKRYDSRLVKRLLTYLRPHRTKLILALLCNLLMAALGPLRPYLTKVAIDGPIATGDHGGLVRLMGWMLLALVAQATLLYGLTYLMQTVGQKIIYALRVKLFAHITRLDLAFFDKTPVGKAVTRVTNDIDALDEMFSSGIVMIVTDLLMIAWIMVFMVKTNWQLALATLTIVPLLLGLSFMFRIKARAAFRDVRTHLGALNGFMQEHVVGMKIVQLFTREKDELKRFGTINNDYRDANVRTIYYYALYFPAVEFLSTMVVAVIIWYGGGQILRGHGYTFGELAAFIQFVEMFFRPIFDLSDKYNVLQNALAAAERIFGLLDSEPKILSPATPQPWREPRGAVEFRDVWFAYNEPEYVLKGINLTIPAGKTVAVVGATGAGKTTLSNLICRFYDVNKGTVLVDGQDVKTFDLNELRGRLAVVLQDVFLFPGTIYDNLSMEDARITRERVIAAARLVGADKFIDKLPAGYDTVLGENGGALSVGEKQLLSFARALARDPLLLILDEATSSVDAETEHVLQRAIALLLKGRTAIVIAHRLSTIKHADQIVVMHKGEVREVGTHSELLALNGIYARLYQLQYKEQEALFAGDPAVA